jgi:hypothetical protein
MATRDEILDQVPFLKTKYPSYKSYAEATINTIFSKEQLATATHLQAEEFRSGIFINDAGTFHFNAFENTAQVFPVRDFLIDDFTKSGMNDLLMIGNNYAVRAQSGRYDAGKGLLLAQKSEPTFSSVINTGFLCDKDARKMIRIDNFLIVANNNDTIQIFRIN